jgi:hypothetical protein
MVMPISFASAAAQQHASEKIMSTQCEKQPNWSG